MRKRRIIGAMLASAIAVSAASASLAGCSLVTSNTTADMLQVIATVNISEAEGLSEADVNLISEYKDTVGTTEIYKDELVAAFINVGTTYINYGYSYYDVFTMLVESLVENAVIIQYATMYLLNDKAGTGLASTVIEEYNSYETYAEQLEYLLRDENADDPDKDIKIAKYNLYSSLNYAIDSLEQSLIKSEDSTTGSGSRTTPTGVDTESDDYYPKAPAGDEYYEEGDLYYNVYTGYQGYLRDQSGAYQDDALDGTNALLRKEAYNQFMTTLIKNGLVDPYKDNLLDIVNGIEYVNKEYVSQLENRVMNKYYDLYEKEQENKLTNGGSYAYLDAVYKTLLANQEKNAESSFTSTLGSISDTSFILYSPDTEEDGGGTYGYVYNILLPYSETQSASLSALKADPDNKDDAGNYTYNYYNGRNKILKQIKTTDQRAAWFNGTTDYSFKAEEAGFTPALASGEKTYYAGKDSDREYLFFENNLTNPDQYEDLDKYAGQYAYNGRVIEKEDGTYKLIPNKLDIDGMLEEFQAYIEYILGTGTVTYNKTEGYYDEFVAEGEGKSLYTDDTKDKTKDADKEIDYNKFIYATGTVALSDNSSASFRRNLLNKETDQYKALSAVNELQYAYTTDTGVLSQYLGYSVTLGDTTGYIKEFEAAAHEALERGAGAFNVCAGDYGWHLIYVTYTFEAEGGAVYGEELDWETNVGVEGTFENLFYEWVKSNDISEISTTRRTEIMLQFKNDNTINRIQKNYQDLLNL